MLQIEKVLADRYQLQTQLSDRPGCQTWLAVDLADDRNALAIVKLLPVSPQIQWEDLKLFEREARVLQHLNHPQIPQYRDYFQLDAEQTGGLPGFGLVQEYIPGQTLQQMLDRGVRFTEAAVRSLAVQLLEILIYLHELSPPVLHRDIKPSNIIFQPESSDENPDRGILQGTVFLIDFGSVRDRAVAEGATFTVVGTGGYAPPEQLWGRATPASDLYALGATLIHLLTGKSPVNLPQKRMRLQFRDCAYLTPQFADWLDKLIDPAPERRFSAARLALEDLKSDHWADRNPLAASAVSEPIDRSKSTSLRISPWVKYGLVGCAAFWLLWNTAFAKLKPLNMEARSYIEKMNYAQQAYLRKNGQFSSSFDALNLEFPSQTDDYQYSIEVTPLAVFNRATPRHQKFNFFEFQKPRGFVGAVYAIGPKATAEFSIVCHATSPGMSPLPSPIIQDKIAKCAEGTVEPPYLIGIMGPVPTAVGADWEIVDRTLGYIANGEMGKAIELANTIENPTYQLMTFHALADKYAAMGDSEQADRWNERSFAIAKSIQSVKSKGPGWVRLPNLLDFSDRYAAIGNTDLAAKLWTNALEAAKNVPLKAAKSLPRDTWDFQDLAEVAAHANTPDRQDKILNILHIIPKVGGYSSDAPVLAPDVLEALVPHLKTSERQDLVLQIVSELRYDEDKANILKAIAPNLKSTEPQFDRAVQIANTIEDKQMQKQVLEALDR